jgi:thioredoxin-like negative regulator of GroEL
MTQATFVACLCAEWCSACRAYRADFEQAARGAGAARFAWIDIEDHPEVMGDVDIETFPTLLIAQAGAPVFFGAVAPHASTLAGLVDRAMRGEFTPLRDAAAAELTARAMAAAGG